jgi:DNA-binding protein Fis
MILESHLPAEISSHSRYSNTYQGDFKLPDSGVDLDGVEKNFILQALKLTGGNQTKASNLLGISRHTLRYRMEKYDLL